MRHLTFKRRDTWWRSVATILFFVTMASMLVSTASLIAQPATSSVPPVNQLQIQASNGNVSAQLATMYDRGIAVPTNHAEALNLYRKAALHGFVPAFRQMAWQYDNGIGTATNSVEACAWIKLYRSRWPDNEHGMNFEKFMLKKMTPEQLAKADERFAELKAEVPPTEPEFSGLMSLFPE